MIDLHTHILPGIDDGAKNLEMSLEMARMAVEDGTTVLACTPHIYPGLYMNTQEGIKAECAKLQKALDVFHIPLKLVVGADAHLVPELLEGLQTGRVPTLNGSQYFLLEPSHHVPPPNLEESVFQFVVAGYIPVVTHPERLVWIEHQYPTFVRLAQRGVWMQLTAGAIVGKFGKRARYWSERMLDEGLVHLVASDAHTVSMRSPKMADARERLVQLVGEAETQRLLVERPQAILNNAPTTAVQLPPGLITNENGDLPERSARPWYRRFF